MANFRALLASLMISAFIGYAIAHPGEQHTPEQLQREALARRAASTNWARSLSNCANNPDFLARRERAVARRAETAKALRQKRGIEHKSLWHKRDTAALETWMAVDHNQTSLGYTLETDAATLFSSNATCALVEEADIGPYFVAGELIRQDITEGQAGIPLHLEMQIVDVSDCSAVSNLLVDIWHCNATGVYSGVAATGQGGLNSTWFRGVQETDDEGVVEFDTKFPGHYAGRATHIHVITTKNATVLDNSTYDGGVATHIGQLFFDQSLITAVEATSPYTSNEQELTENADDSIAAGEATSDYDIFVDYVLLGDLAEDGLMAWITVGVDIAASQNVSAAAHYYAGGGVAASSGGGMGGGPPDNSTTSSTSTTATDDALGSATTTSGANRRSAKQGFM